MRGLATAAMLAGLLWLAFWAAKIGIGGTQGRLPEAAFVAGLIVTSASLAYLTREETRTQARIDRRLRGLRRYPHLIAVNPSRSPENGHSPHSRTWPKTARRVR